MREREIKTQHSKLSLGDTVRLSPVVSPSLDIRQLAIKNGNRGFASYPSIPTLHLHTIAVLLMAGSESPKISRSKGKAARKPSMSLAVSPKPRVDMHNKKASMACTLCRALRKKVCTNIAKIRT